MKHFVAAVLSFTRDKSNINKLITYKKCSGYFIYVFHVRFKEQSAAGRPCSCVTTKTITYWDECLPSSGTLKEHNYLCGQPDANAQKIAEVTTHS